MSRLLASWDWISPYQTPVLLFYLPSVSNFCSHQTVINITVSYPERWHIENIRMPSPLFQYVIYLIANLPMRRGLGVIMKVSVQELRVLDDWIFWGDEVCYSTAIIITIFVLGFISNCRCENNFCSQFRIKISSFPSGTKEEKGILL
jgi:hypothetical protein